MAKLVVPESFKGKEEFLRFRYLSGFGEESYPDFAKTLHAPSAPPEESAFKGWNTKDGATKSHSSNKKRVSRWLRSAFGTVSASAFITGLNESEDDEEQSICGLGEAGDVGSSVLHCATEIKDLGLLCGSVDVVVKPTDMGIRQLPVHAGQTAMDDCLFCVEFATDLSKLSAEAMRVVFVKFVLIQLVRERATTLYFTDIVNRVIKISCQKAPRGFPIVHYELLHPHGLIDDMKAHCQKGQKPLSNIAEAIRRLKLSWVAPQNNVRQQPPFGTGRHAAPGQVIVKPRAPEEDTPLARKRPKPAATSGAGKELPLAKIEEEPAKKRMKPKPKARPGSPTTSGKLLKPSPISEDDEFEGMPKADLPESPLRGSDSDPGSDTSDD